VRPLGAGHVCFLMAVDITSTIEYFVTITDTTRKTTGSRSLPPLRSFAGLRPWYTDTITRCVRVLDVLKHGGGLHFGFICIDALYVLTHQRLALYLINKLDDGRKVGRPMARVLKGPVRSRNGVDRHARGHMGAAHGALALEDMECTAGADRVEHVASICGQWILCAHTHCLVHGGACCRHRLQQKGKEQGKPKQRAHASVCSR